jgi:hypothetical protein
MPKNLENTAQLYAIELGPEELAKVLDISRVHVRGLAKDGVIPKAQRGRYPLIPCVQAYIAHIRREEKVDSLTTQRARWTQSRADMAEMERGRLLGMLLPANEVRAAWSAKVVAFKMRVLAIPSKVAARLVMVRTAAQVKAILEPECREALEDLQAGQIEIIDHLPDDGPHRPGRPRGPQSRRTAPDANGQRMG